MATVSGLTGGTSSRTRRPQRSRRGASSRRSTGSSCWCARDETFFCRVPCTIAPRAGGSRDTKKGRTMKARMKLYRPVDADGRPAYLSGRDAVGLAIDEGLTIELNGPDDAVQRIVDLGP